MPDSVYQQAANTAEREFELSLRPRRLAEFIGQRNVVENLSVYIQAAKKRGEALDHILFSGMPGLGKTTLANLIATELGSNMHATSGPALERAGECARGQSHRREDPDRPGFAWPDGCRRGQCSAVAVTDGNASSAACRSLD